mmetsp:Transcript_38296/g.114678  ORF Transcript_38296/g.114678 Transcript_38296/m.114678 type:complete len:673 (+) Transcript_38296:181-2199(+)
MRKIKFTQQTISDRLTQILDDFPRLSDVHPFYSDLSNVLYDRDHYKLALGQINTARTLCDAIGRDMVRMVKYGDSLYRCKCLKRAALGRMCTVLKRQKASLAYLEEVRKHMSRLPALDPSARTLLLCGLPNVGKSSFLNKITRAEVDVQPYAFTTKSLYVGHTDYRYLRWQVVDTPGILDHPLEERNTIEMQAVTALAHLTCSVLYFVDISESCGYPVEEQCSLFRSIKPLFANKQLVVVINKVDAQPWETLDEGKKTLIQSMVDETDGCTLMTMSNHNEKGVSEVKNAACDKLLAARVESRVSGRKVEGVMNRLQVFHPTARDSVARDVCIPESVVKARDEGRLGEQKKSRVGYSVTKEDMENGDAPDGEDAAMDDATKKKTARELMWENGGPGVWSPDFREQYDLLDAEWKFDAIPEILDGKNVADYVDPDIDAKLDKLEREEAQLVAELEAAGANVDEESDLDEDEELAVGEIRHRQEVARRSGRRESSARHSKVGRSIRGRNKDKHDVGPLDEREIKRKMDILGVDTTRMVESMKEGGRKRERGRSVERRGRSRTSDDSPERSAAGGDADMEDAVSKTQAKRRKREASQARARSLTRGRSSSRAATREPSQVGLKDEAAFRVAAKKEMIGQKKWKHERRSGEGDNRKAEHLIKWCNTGKKRNGTHYQR